jgi:monoamine oxidase
MIWSKGTVKRVADGLTDKRSSRAHNVLPAGAVLWAWDADLDFDEQAGEQWPFLLPKKRKQPKHIQVYSWRLDPCELGAAQASAPDPARKRARRVCDDA